MPASRHARRSHAESALLNTACGCLCVEPRFEEKDGAAAQMRRLAPLCGPEFVLQLALYVRDDLGIRSTANFLLAVASTLPRCAPYLRKYLPAAVRLPSDLIQLAQFSKALCGTLPSALRKALAARFAAFDEFSLAKYDKNYDKKLAPGVRPLSLKALVRMLHVSKPVHAVMSLLGKKYPLDADAYAASGLDGAFDAARAGKRMRLAVPLTWETELSAKGNKAEVWERLHSTRHHVTRISFPASPSAGVGASPRRAQAALHGDAAQPAQPAADRRLGRPPRHRRLEARRRGDRRRVAPVPILLLLGVRGGLDRY